MIIQITVAYTRTKEYELEVPDDLDTTLDDLELSDHVRKNRDNWVEVADDTDCTPDCTIMTRKGVDDPFYEG